MNQFTLSTTAFIRLKAQLNLNGAFNHTLYNTHRMSVRSVVAIEQCHAALHVKVTIGRSCSSITVDRTASPDTRRIARFIEACANATPFDLAPFDEETELASEIEITLRSAVRLGRGTYYLDVEEIRDLCVGLSPTRSGLLLATIEADDVSVQVLLPRDIAKAYVMLAENVQTFITGHRNAQAA